MGKITFNGFPEKVGEHIELPNIAELMMMPCFRWADIADVYKHGTEFQRFLIDKTPLSGDNTYINVITQVQFLQPSINSLVDRVADYDRNWHVDGSFYNKNTNDQTHLLVSDVDARTEFNTTLCELEHRQVVVYDDYIDFIRKINETELNLNPVKMEPNKILTFTPFHIHRAPKPYRPELRFMWRVYESNHCVPLTINESMSNRSIVGRSIQELTSIEKTEDKIIIYLNN